MRRLYKPEMWTRHLKLFLTVGRRDVISQLTARVPGGYLSELRLRNRLCGYRNIRTVR